MRATAAHSNLHFWRSAIYPSSHRYEKGDPARSAVYAGVNHNLRIVHVFEAEVLRLSSSDSLRTTIFVWGIRLPERELSSGPRCDTLTAFLRRMFPRIEPI